MIQQLLVRHRHHRSIIIIIITINPLGWFYGNSARVREKQRKVLFCALALAFSTFYLLPWSNKGQSITMHLKYTWSIHHDCARSRPRRRGEDAAISETMKVCYRIDLCETGSIGSMECVPFATVQCKKTKGPHLKYKQINIVENNANVLCFMRKFFCSHFPFARGAERVKL